MLVGGGSAAAAAAAIAIALVVLPNLSVRSGATLIAQASASPSTFRLEDGTTVVLDRGGRARVAMRPDARHVILEAGHAVFAVADDATRPFVVDAASRRIVARSRRFEVGIEDGTAQIVPLDGRLEVGGQGKGLAVDAPRMLVPAFHVPPIDMSMGDATSASATADDGRVTFEDQTLAEVALAANRFEGPALRFVGAVATRRVTGVFDIRNHAALARKLASAFNLQVETSAREIVLRQK